MTIDISGRDFIYKQEGVILHAYKDAGGVWTIGAGFTFYPGGKLVKEGDSISLNQCDLYFDR